MKRHCFFPAFLACILAGCGSSENPYGFTWGISTLVYTAYDDAKCGLMRHVYAAPGATFPDFETVIEKAEKIKSVSSEFNPSPNAITDHAFLFKYEGRKAIYYGRFVQETNHPSQLLPIFPAGEITNLPSFIAKLKSPSDPVSAFLIRRFSEGARRAIAGWPESRLDEKTLAPLLVQEINAIIIGPSIYEEDRFRRVRLRPATLRLLKMDLQPPPGMRPSRQQMTAALNRILLEDAYPLNLPIPRENKMQNYVAIKY